MTKGLVYYTHNEGDLNVRTTVRAQLGMVTALPIVSVSLNLVPEWSRDVSHVVLTGRGPGYLTMFKQILVGLELLDADVAFLVEHDVLYHQSHFDFEPERLDTVYYNQHTWRVHASDGQAVFYYCNQVSGICASRALLIEHYLRVVAHVEAYGFDRALGFEPGGNRRQQALHAHPIATWMSAGANVDIKSGSCLTKWRGSPDQFRNKDTCRGWTEADAVPGWGVTKGRFSAFLDDVARGARGQA